MFYLTLQDLFSKLTKISNDNWQIQCMFDNWSPIYTTEEVCQIIDKAFLEYKKKYIAEIQQYTYANLENNLKQKLNNKHQ